MKISIITVVYNNVATIEDAINSVLLQTYNNIEYIIIDGGSNDGTLDILNKYKNRLSKLISEPDKGIYDAMNKGLKMATGEVVGILNSDDLLNGSTIIENIMKEFILDMKLDAIYGDLVYVNRYDTNIVVRTWRSKTYYNNFFENGNVPPHTSLFLKNHIYISSGYFNLSLKLASDYEFMLRVFKHNITYSKYIPHVFVRMRLGGSTNKNMANIIKGNIEVLKSWKLNNLNIPIMLMPLRVIKRLVQFF